VIPDSAEEDHAVECGKYVEFCTLVVSSGLHVALSQHLPSFLSLRLRQLQLDVVNLLNYWSRFTGCVKIESEAQLKATSMASVCLSVCYVGGL